MIHNNSVWTSERAKLEGHPIRIEGWEAFCDGSSAFANPYPRGDHRWTEWNKGWMDAHTLDSYERER